MITHESNVAVVQHIRNDTEVKFDVTTIPFSRRGSWLNLSPVVALHTMDPDVHLVSHISGMHAVLRITPRYEGDQVDTSVYGTAAVLTWEGTTGRAEAVFESVNRIRFRGDGFNLRFAEAESELTPFTGTYLYRDPIDGSGVYTSYETGRRYRITALTGELHFEGAEALGRAQRWVEARGDHWEVVVEEFRTSRPTYQTEMTFDEIHRHVATEFHDFLDSVAPWRSEEVPATPLAAYVLWSAVVSPAGFLEREGVLMSKHWMDKVWSWDHCFNALALGEGDPQLAIDQFLLPFDHQTGTGALPDSVTHSEKLYNYVKPPIHGWAYTLLGQLVSDEMLRPVIPEIYDRLAAWTRFWLDSRRVPGHALPHYQHGNDSGWDNATTFDYDRVIESPDLAAFLLIQLRVVTELARQCAEADPANADRFVADIERWSAETDEISAGLSELWRDGEYIAISVETEREAKRSSLLTLLPIILGEKLSPTVSDALAERIGAHLTDYGIATEMIDSGDYEADGYWRGPIWAPSTVLIEDGLRRAGHHHLADLIRSRFLRLCEKSGFAENFDAVTGDGLRDRAYTWTAAAYLIFARARAKAH